MSYLDHRLVTEEQRERLRAARFSGRQCAACGRDIAAGETVYIELFTEQRAWDLQGSLMALVGIECASTELLERTQGEEAERCAQCGRGVYYRVLNPRRRRAVCSRNCATLASAATKPKAGSNQVSDAAHRLTTEDEREQFHAARRHGRMCAACGREIAADETVYVEPFVDERTWARHASAWALVGVECASTELLELARREEPERCESCGRAMYHHLGPRRHRAVCSRRCANRARAARLRQAED